LNYRLERKFKTTTACDKHEKAMASVRVCPEQEKRKTCAPKT
jgi:hypothetical protein